MKLFEELANREGGYLTDEESTLLAQAFVNGCDHDMTDAERDTISQQVEDMIGRLCTECIMIHMGMTGDLALLFDSNGELKARLTGEGIRKVDQMGKRNS